MRIALQMIDYLPKEPYKRVFVLVFYATLACILFYLFFRFFWIPLLPFLLAVLLSAIIRPICLFLQRKFRIPIRLSTLILLFLLIFGSIFLLYRISMRLLAEAGEFLAKEELASTDTKTLAGILQDRLADWFPFAKEYLASRGFGSAIRESLRSGAGAITSSIPGLISDLITRLPLILFFIAVLMIASYYLITDRDHIFAGLKKILPERIIKEIHILRRQAGDSLMEYLKAALILLLVTFLELFLGFTLLKTPYSLTLAVIIAAIDFFPILGTGTVMIPWALFSFLAGNTQNAIGLLVLWAIISAVRQALEPRIIGKKLGLHPFHALAAMYFGFSLFSFTGLVLAPLAVTVLLGVLKEKGNPVSRRNSVQKP